MRTTIRAAFAAMAMTAACGAGATGGENPGGFAYLQGAWTSTITPRNCVSGDALAPALRGISAFHQGGTLTESRESAPMNPRGPGHGVWYRSGKRQFTVKIVFQRYDLNGFLLGTQEILSTNTVSADSKTADVKATFKVLDNLGVTLVSGCASGEAQRIAF